MNETERGQRIHWPNCLYGLVHTFKVPLPNSSLNFGRSPKKNDSK